MAKDATWFTTGDDWMFNTAPIVAARKTEDTDGKMVEVYLYTAESLEQLEQYVPADEEMSKQTDAPIHFAGPQAQVVWDFLKWGAFDLEPRLNLAKRDWEKPPGKPDLADPTEPTFVDASQWVLDLIHNDFIIEVIRARDIDGENPQVLIKLPGMDTATWMSVNEATAAVRNVVGVLMRDEPRKPSKSKQESRGDKK